MSSNPWRKWFFPDWDADPGLKLCSLAAQGIWMRLLCRCDESDRFAVELKGKPLSTAQIAKLVGVSEHEVVPLIEELEANDVFSRDPDGAIFSRRMRRDRDKAEGDKANGRKGGNPSLKGGENGADKPRQNGGVNPQDKAQKLEARSQDIPPNPPSGGRAQAEKLSRDLRAIYPPDGIGSPEKVEEACLDLIEAGDDPEKILGGTRGFLASSSAKPERGRVLSLVRHLRERRWLNYLDTKAIPARRPWPGPPELRAELVRLATLASKIGDDWAKSWVDPGGWRQTDTSRAIIAHSETARKQIDTIAGDYLRSEGIQVLVVQESAA